MEKINGVCIEGRFYEAIKEKDCSDCDFDKNLLKCRDLCGLCDYWDCAFRYSPELTAKLNEK